MSNRKKNASDDFHGPEIIDIKMEEDVFEMQLATDLKYVLK